MSFSWDNTVEKTDGNNTIEEFEAAVYRLVTEQVIYHSDKNRRLDYHLISRFEREFKQALAPLGVTLSVNTRLRYAYAIPKHTKTGTASVNQTLFALVLRNIYDKSARIGQFNDDGEVICNLVDFEENYRLDTGRDLPNKGEVTAILKTLNRWGIAKKDEEYEVETLEPGSNVQPFVIVIKPAIVDVLGENAMSRLGVWNNKNNSSKEPNESSNSKEVL